jgi:hypothetical protein
MWDGTLYGQWEAWSVFVFMLAHCDPEGFLDMTPEAIAGRSGLPLDVIRRGIDVLESPDDGSRSTELEGRRLERIDAHREWGWRIVNYLKYREYTDPETVRQQNRERQKRYRERLRNAPSRPVTLDNARSRQAEVEVEVEVSGAKAPSCPIASDDSVSVEEWFVKEFWPRFPKKEGKKAALKAMLSAFKGVSGPAEDALAGEIISGLSRYCRHVEGKDRGYVKMAEGWINGRRWEDQLDA